MKKSYFLIIVLFAFTAVKSQTINFPDPNFKAKLLQSATWNYIAQTPGNVSIKLDANSNGEIEVSEALNIASLDLQGDANISDLTGIGYFTNLTRLEVYNNPLLTSINLTGLNNLLYLNCPNNSLTSINNIGAPSLTKLDCWNNQITTIDLTNWPNLYDLLITGNNLTSLSIANMPTMQRIFCDGNQLTSLNLQNLPNLTTLDAKQNLLSGFSISGLGNVTSVNFAYNLLPEINLSHFPSATNVSVEGNLLETVDASMLYHLTVLDCDSNSNLKSILSKNGKNEILHFNFCRQLEYICVDDV